MQKVAVIGCNSFSGSYVVDELLASGQYDVVGVDRVAKDELWLPYLPRAHASFRLYLCDVNRDMDRLQEVLASEQPEFVMNLAALSEVAPSWEHPAQWMQTNVVALTALVDFLRTLPRLKKYVHISTPEVYGHCQGAVREDQPVDPSTPYAASKAAADLSILTFVKRYGFPAVFMRAANVYGPHQQLHKIIPRTFVYLKAGRRLPLEGGGKSIRAFIHIRDTVRAYIAGFTLGQVGEAYHVAPPQTVTIAELVGKIAALSHRTVDDCVTIVPARPGHDTAYILDARKAATTFVWQPTISLDQGLREVQAWIEQSWEHIRSQALTYVHQP